MKGLLIKDFKLMKGQKNFFITIIAMAIVMTVFMENSSFSISYVTLVSSLFTLSTISYDEFENGNAFLFSLPVSRKKYTAEKYVFGIIIGVVSWLIVTVITVIYEYSRSSIMVKYTVIAALLILPILLIILSVMIPFHLKFGGEKGRIALLVLVGLVFLTAFLAVRIAGLFNIDLTAMLHNLPAIRTETLTIFAFGTAIIVLLISLKISIGIMYKKEF